MLGFPNLDAQHLGIRESPKLVEGSEFNPCFGCVNTLVTGKCQQGDSNGTLWLWAYTWVHLFLEKKNQGKGAPWLHHCYCLTWAVLTPVCQGTSYWNFLLQKKQRTIRGGARALWGFHLMTALVEALAEMSQSFLKVIFKFYPTCPCKRPKSLKSVLKPKIRSQRKDACLLSLHSCKRLLPCLKYTSHYFFLLSFWNLCPKSSEK